MEPAAGIVGRARETDGALTAIAKGANVLVTGRAGVGKSAFLQDLYERLSDRRDANRLLWAPSGTTKHVLTELARQIHGASGLLMPESHLPPRNLARAKRLGSLPWNDVARTMRRLPIPEAQEVIADSLRGRGYLVMIDSLEVPPSQAALFAEMIGSAQTVACMDDDNRRTRIDRLLWRFSERIELKPLPLADCETIIERWLADHPLRFTGAGTRRRFVRHVARASHGVPAAIREMLHAAGQEQEITPAKARGFEHEAGIRYLDMTPAIVIGLVGFIALRYISRGIGEVEMLVLSGVASAVFMGLRYFMFRMRTG